VAPPLHPWALVLVGGVGARLGADRPKQFIEVAGHSLVVWAFHAIDQACRLDGLIVVAAAEHRSATQALLDGRPRRAPELRWADGGPTRQDSVASGLAALPDDCDAVLVHDGARPFVGAPLVERLLDGLRRADAVVPGVAESCTLKRVGHGGEVVETVERAGVVRIQTPQVFRPGLLRRAHEQARRDGVVGTDDGMLVENLGQPVLVVEGDEFNLKVTTKRDIFLMQCLVNLARSAPGSGPPSPPPGAGDGL